MQDKAVHDMDVITMKAILEALTGKTFFINSFPHDMGENVKFILADYVDDGAGMFTAYIRLSSKAGHPLRAEALLKELHTTLYNRTEEFIGNYQVILTVPETNVPIYEDMLANGEYMYSLEVKMLLLFIG